MHHRVLFPGIIQDHATSFAAKATRARRRPGHLPDTPLDS